MNALRYLPLSADKSCMINFGLKYKQGMNIEKLLKDKTDTLYINLNCDLGSPSEATIVLQQLRN